VGALELIDRIALLSQNWKEFRIECIEVRKRNGKC
jgi:hypothetical protein